MTALTEKKNARHGRDDERARISLADLERIAERVLKLSEAEETEVEIGATTDALTRFANNTIHQNVAEHTLAISVRAVVDGRTARATTNKTDDESLRRAAAAAASLARNEPRNPDLLPMLRAQKYQKVARCFAATAETTPQDRARAVKRVCQMAEKRKQTAAGIFSSGLMQSVLANSRGLFARYEQTRAEFSVTILEENSSGWAKGNSPDVRTIGPDELAERASRKCADSR
ncbi:MAG TPA: DNA gyrase modulator, partial [Candidatus Acidoferrales bacterium]|nr:DNA gyrase modulator [Candidatus Acidoferrales bacterium]